MKKIKRKYLKGTSIQYLNNEIEILRNLSHPNLIQIFEYYVDDEHVTIITDSC